MLRIVPAGIALIGVSYGLARYDYGLFLPAIRTDVGLSLTAAGVTAGSSYAAYCGAVLASPLMVEHFGVRAVAILAGGTATVGMGLIGISTAPAMLVFAVLLAGLSAGLASPPMAEAVSANIPVANQPRANTLINSGTSVGVAVSGPIALTAAGDWRVAYLMFAAIASLVTVWVALSMPRDLSAPRRRVSGSLIRGPSDLFRRDALPVMIAAAAMGFSSAAYWTFSDQAVVVLGGLSSDSTAALWVTIGMFGLIGGTAGDLVQRVGIHLVHCASLIALAAASLLLVLAPSDLPLVMFSSALFGAAYIMLTGIYLVWGIDVYADRPAVGLSLPFLMIAVGQVVGSTIAGMLLDSAGYPVTFAAFAGIALLTMATSRGNSQRPRSSVQKDKRVSVFTR